MTVHDPAHCCDDPLTTRAARLDGDILGMEVQLQTQDDGRILWTVQVGVDLVIDTPIGNEHIEHTVCFDGWLDQGSNVVPAEVWDAVERAIESTWKAAA